MWVVYKTSIKIVLIELSKLKYRNLDLKLVKNTVIATITL